MAKEALASGQDAKSAKDKKREDNRRAAYRKAALVAVRRATLAMN